MRSRPSSSADSSSGVGRIGSDAAQQQLLLLRCRLRRLLRLDRPSGGCPHTLKCADNFQQNGPKGEKGA